MDAIEWLKENKDVLRISAVEREIGCPTSTLQNFFQEKQGLPQKWREPLVKWVKTFVGKAQKIKA